MSNYQQPQDDDRPFAWYDDDGECHHYKPPGLGVAIILAGAILGLIGVVAWLSLVASR